MRKPRQHLSSKFVHVTQRGLGKRIIFEDGEDKRRYLEFLKSKLEGTDIRVLAWVLMDNHSHLLIQALPSDLSRLMQRLGVSYAQYFNGRHGHVGKVFQNRFSSEAIEDDAYLKAVIRYIHRNPENANLADKETYPWSSYREICGRNNNLEGSDICDTASVIELFGNLEALVAFHEDESVNDGFARLDGYRPRMSDEEARAIAIKHYGVGFADRISGMRRSERDEALRRLKDRGISIRQLQRLTGIGRGPITKA